MLSITTTTLSLFIGFMTMSSLSFNSWIYSLRYLISVPSLTKSMRSNYQLISTNLLDLFELKSISWPKRETFLSMGRPIRKMIMRSPFLGVSENVKDLFRSVIYIYIWIVQSWMPFPFSLTFIYIHRQNHLSLLGKRQGGNDDFQGTAKLIETKMTQSSICHQKI
jgi:hypothetical protein